MNLEDAIKINQMIRAGIDFDGFNTWYRSLTTKEQNSLISTLIQFAYQAGVYDVTWEKAMQIGASADDALAARVKSFHRTDIGLHNWIGFASWLDSLSTENRKIVFLIAVSLFGVAEGDVFRHETVESCNHWWHRDLLDKRVVDAILRDPEFYRTSMKNDGTLQS